MKQFICFKITLLILLSITNIYSQENLHFTMEDFLSVVAKNHPLSKQADLYNDIGKAQIQIARGDFDPSAFSEYVNKIFKGKEYFSLLDYGLKIPTWYGIELKTGIESNKGLQLNPEEITPPYGLYYAGISVPIGQGLLIDSRRNALKNAKLMAQMNVQERQLALNDLFYDAILSYLEWSIAWQKMNVSQSAYEISLVRYEGVKNQYEFGSRAAIDTLEAMIIVQNRLYAFNSAKAEWITKGFEVSNFLWDEKMQPLVVDTLTFPDSLNQLLFYMQNNFESTWIFSDFKTDAHPSILNYNLKLEILNNDKKLKANKLLPKFNANYNYLSEAYFTNGDFGKWYQPANNFKWGFYFSMPLFLRKERGDLALTKIKIRTTQLDLIYKKQQLINKSESYKTQFKIYEDQQNLLLENVLNYRLLLEAEKTKFEMGESSIFLLNSRENSYLESQLKYQEIAFKRMKTVLTGLLVEGKLGF